MPSKRILIVDDDPAIRGLVRAVLRREEAYAIDEASTNSEALERFRAQPYDAIVLDLFLSGGNGFDMLAFLEREHPGVRCVVISAGSQRALDQVRASNVVAKLRKPFDIDELVTALRTCFEH